MKQKKTIGALVFLASSIIASLCSAESNFMTYEDWEEMSSQFQGNKHQLVLKNGSKFYGTLVQLPSLQYTFASMDFDIHEILAVVSAKTSEGIKLQYVCHTGQNYIASNSSERFVFSCEEQSLDGTNKQIKKEIDPLLVDYILLNQPSIPYAGYNENLASMEFQNGDQLPIVLLSEALVLTDGWSEKSIRTQDIIQLSFQGGIHAKINKEGRKVDIDFSYIKDPYLCVQVTRNQHHMKFPWGQIAHLQTGNGGFFREREVQAPRTLSALTQDKSIEVHTHKIGLGWHKQNDLPDQMGLQKGNELIEAFAAIPILQDAITELNNLGNEPIIASPPMFAEDESDLLAASILLEDFEAAEIISEDAIAAMEGLGNEPVVSMEQLFSENVEEDEDIHYLLNDWLVPLFSSELTEEDDLYVNFMDDDLDPYITTQDLLDKHIAIAEDFDIQDSIGWIEVEDSELDYLEDIALEMDLMSVVDQPAITEHNQNALIGIDEIVAQEEEFYASENVDPAEIVGILWNEDDKETSIFSKTEEVFIDTLWD